MTDISICSAHKTVFTLLAGREHMPAAIWGAFALGSKVRMIWHSWRAMNTVQMYSDKDNFYPLIKGGLAQVCANKFTFLRVFAYYCLVTHRVKKCKDTINEINLKVSRILSVIKGHYTAPSSGVSKRHKFLLLSPSKGNRTVKSVQTLWQRLSTSIVEMCILTKLLGKLFLEILDAADAFYVNPFNQEHNVRLNELFINGKGFLNNLIEGQENVIDMLENNEELFRGTLDKSKTLHGQTNTRAYTYDSFLAMIKKVKKETETTQRIVNKFDGVIDQFIYHATTGAAICLGLKDWAKFVPVPKSKEKDMLLGEEELMLSTSTGHGEILKLI